MIYLKTFKVRDFLLNVLKTENSKLAEDEEIIEQYKIETKKVQEKIAELKSSAVTFQVCLSFSLL